MSDQSAGNVDPNLRMFGDMRASTRYPSPFFDISQQYMPPTVKELFKWVYFYATNNSFLGPALNKIARYPVTDLIIEDKNDKIVEFWKILLVNTLQIKLFQMETNFDLVTYGNAFVTIHYPFSRMLECGNCKERYPWKAIPKKIDNLRIIIKCKKCLYNGDASIHDVPFKSVENVRLVRINPENIDIKYNDATGRHTYLYSIPDKLRRQIMAGDTDIIEDTPKIYIDAIKARKKIKLNNQNLFHLKRPTLAGKDMGWGLPMMSNALKDLYYFYTLRRGQEAIINEQITPFDIIFPQTNGKFDPYVHTDLSNWKSEIRKELQQKRKDPNYKSVLPFPVGYERIGGDGKALMLTPELDFLSKAIISSQGIPQEFINGGTMNWTGSSVSLRTLENEFLHHRSGLLQMTIWISERLRVYLGVAAPKSLRFSDFKMADDMQKLQMMIGMASNKKISWNDVVKELGKDPEVENRKIEEENIFESKLERARMIANAEAQAEAQRITNRIIGEQESAIKPKIEADPGQVLSDANPNEMQTINIYVQKLMEQPPEVVNETLSRIAKKDPEFARKLKITLEQSGYGAQAQMDNAAEAEMDAGLNNPKAPTQSAPANVVPMTASKPAANPTGKPVPPSPQQRAPRRQGGV